ncbi:MAG TPA: type II CAAX endopeptidase family protein [Anaerolineales bacterium]|nr:type II CAAX endopeptidase family protein [Anaerolineales bacterium]
MSAIIHASVETRKPFVEKYPLTAFFLLAIGLTWIFMITDALGSHGIIPFRLPLPLLIVMGYMPTLAAVLVAGRTGGKEAIRALFRKLLIVRVSLGWYLLAIFGLAVIYVAVIILHNLLAGSPALPILSDNLPPLPPLQLALSTVPMFLLIGIVNGEELAWRGFALPRLQAKYNALTSSLILGMVWAFFHLPLFFTVTGSSQADWAFPSFLISTLAMSVLYTWLFNNTRGSVLMAYLLHAAANTWSQVFSIDHANPLVGWILTGVLVIAALVSVAVAGAENLSRKTTRIQE